MNKFNLTYLVKENPWSPEPYGGEFKFQPNFFIYDPKGDHTINLLDIDKGQFVKAQFFYLLNTNPERLSPQRLVLCNHSLPELANFIEGATGRGYDSIHRQSIPVARCYSIGLDFISLSFISMNAAEEMGKHLTKGKFV